MARTAANAYLAVMPILPRPSHPRVALKDLRDFLGERRPHQLVFAAAAVAATLVIVLLFVADFRPKREWRPPEIMYVTQWPAARSRAEITAQQAKDLPAQKARLAAEKIAEEERRRQFRRVAKMMGVD